MSDRHDDLTAHSVDQQANDELCSERKSQGGADAYSLRRIAEGSNDRPADSPHRQPPPLDRNASDLIPRTAGDHPRRAHDQSGDLESQGYRQWVSRSTGPSQDRHLKGDGHADKDCNNYSASHHVSLREHAEGEDRLDLDAISRRSARPADAILRASPDRGNCWYGRSRQWIWCLRSYWLTTPRIRARASPRRNSLS